MVNFFFHLFLPLLLAIFLDLLTATPACAALEIKVGTAALSRESIELNGEFMGDHLFIFGVINTNCTVIAKVTGPKHDVVITKKERVYGAWLRRPLMRLKDVDTFYAVVFSHDNVGDQFLSTLQLDTKYLKYPIITADSGANYDEYVSEYINYKMKRLEFLNPENNITFLTKNFFRINIAVPQTIESGNYTAEIFFVKNGKLIDDVSLPFEVINTNIDAIVKKLAYSYSVIYAILAVIISLLLSWVMGLISK